MNTITKTSFAYRAKEVFVDFNTPVCYDEANSNPGRKHDEKAHFVFGRIDHVRELTDGAHRATLTTLPPHPDSLGSVVCIAAFLVD